MQQCDLEYYSIAFWSILVIIVLSISLTLKASSFMTAQRDAIPFNVRVMFDLKNAESIIWDGTASLTEGRIDEIRGIGFEHDDKIYSQNHSWRCLLTKKACGPCGEVVTSKGIMLNITSPSSATVILATKAGNFCVPLHELSLGKSIERYNGRLQIELSPRDFLLTTHRAQDDAPAVTEDTSGRIWVCWVSHRKGKDRIMAKNFNQGEWSDEIKISTRSGKYDQPVIARDTEGGIWIVWAAYKKGNWDLYGRHFKGPGWTRVKRLTRNPSNDIHPKMVSDTFGNTWLCWESYRNGNPDIYLKCFSKNQWSEPIQVTKDPANDRQPDMAIDNTGKIYISWTRFSNDLYRILLKDVQFSIDHETTIAASESPLGHPSIACALDGVWIAWDEIRNAGRNRTEKMDTKNLFYAFRRIGIRCYRNGSIFEPSADIYKGFPFPLKQHAELPHLMADRNGKLWVFFHNYLSGLPHSVWRIYGVYYQGERWSEPILFPHYTWKNCSSVDSCCDQSGNLWIAWDSDNRDLGSSFLSDRDIYAGYLGSNDTPRQSLHLTPAEVRASDSNGHYPEKSGANLLNSQNCPLVWGTIYQPNNVKGYNGLDGFVMDIYRTVMDDLGLDFLGIGHYLSYEHREYIAWLAEKANNLFSESSRFISLSIPENSQNQLYQGFNDMISEKESAFIGAFVNELSTASIQEALENKSVYIASDKIFLEARIQERPMGSEFNTKAAIPKIDVNVLGTDELYQIDIFRNDACIYSQSPKGKSARFSFLDIRMPRGTNDYHVQVIQKNGEEARTLKSRINAL